MLTIKIIIDEIVKDFLMANCITKTDKTEEMSTLLDLLQLFTKEVLSKLSEKEFIQPLLKALRKEVGLLEINGCEYVRVKKEDVKCCLGVYEMLEINDREYARVD